MMEGTNSDNTYITDSADARGEGVRPSFIVAHASGILCYALSQHTYQHHACQVRGAPTLGLLL